MASTDLPSPIADSADSPVTPSCKNSPRRSIETFNLHAVSISTVYQSDTEGSPRYSSLSASDDTGSISTTSGSFDATFLPPASVAVPRKGVSVENRLARVELGYKSNYHLNEVLSEFCDIGSEYANRLQSLADRMDTTFVGESTGATAAREAFRSYILKLADNQREFVDAVQHECVIPDDISRPCAQIRVDLENAMERYEASEAQRSSLAAAVEDMYLQTKTTVAMCSQAFHEPPSVKTSLHSGMISVFVKFMQKNLELNQVPSDTSRAILDAETGRLSEALRLLDANRLCGMRDSFSKFMVYETARLRSLQYDMNQFINVLEGVKPEVEWSQFESEGYRDLGDLHLQSSHATRHYANYLKTTIPEVFRNYAVSRLALSAPKERVLQRIGRTLSKYIDAVWKDTEETVVMSDFIGEMQSSLVRQVFCNLVTTQSLRSNKLPSISSLKLLGRLFGALLVFSQRQGDAWSGYAILKLSEFIYAIDDSDPEQPQRRSLRNCLYSHEYWSRIPFWEECLLIAIAQDMTAHFDDVRPDSVLRPVTRELTGFKQWMIGFGISIVEANALIERVCSRLCLPVDYTQSLLEGVHP
ncbi:hypothetical protein BaOVIS_009280 [Babesia ovis]|uniref:Uncharacterized protein n=1 Tax=Babesia ovis TaxID=5869 RepID=A0A9W5T8R4_BABOV|nr:hypothetical protein BaOVIS_009280 [Babesia ovis]